MNYFPHDTDAMGDPKMMVLRAEAGLEAVAVYWAVIERIHAEESPLNLCETDVGTKSLSILLGLGYESLATYISTMVQVGLLERIEGTEMVTSARAEAYIEQMDKKRETARRNGKSGGRKPKRNRARNQSGTNVGCKSDATSGDILNVKHINKKEEEKEPNNAAKAANTPPPCPKCGGGTMGTNSSRCGKALYICPDCYEEVYV